MKRSKTIAGRVADWVLWALVVLAPLAGGGSHPYVLPVLAVFAAVAYVATLIALHQTKHRLHIHGVFAACVLLAVYTLLQAVPLPPYLLKLATPAAYDLRAFVFDRVDYWPISYEAMATWGEAAKLFVYAAVAAVAYERTRVRRSFKPIAVAIVIAGVSIAGVAAIQRVLGLERILGFIPTRGSTSAMLTTFANPNHTAGFMTLACLCAIGLAVSDRARDRRTGFLLAATACGAVSVLAFSRGGIVALVFGLVLLGALLFRKQTRSALRHASPALLVAALVLPLAGVLWSAKEIVLELTGTVTEGLGVSEKIAAVQDAMPLIWDHPWLGIGRGAYVSIYPHYKTSALQLTFAYPENIVVQLLSEWGIVVGSAAFVGLVVAVVIRLRKAQSPEQLGVLVGVTALILQNFLDFSFELLGVALPVAAVLGGTGARIVSRWWEITLKSPAKFAIAGVPLVLLGMSVLGNSGSDLYDDVATLEASTRTRVDSSTTSAEISAEQFVAIAERHPANPIVTAQISYLCETAQPPDLRAAVRWANRTLYLAPMYADGHVAVGRLLIRAGYRSQGFGELRRAWALGGSSVLRSVGAMARSPDEMLLAIPRRDPELDVLEERALSSAVLEAMRRGHGSWVPAMFARLGDVDRLPETSLFAVAKAAHAAADYTLAERSIDRLRQLEPNLRDAVLLKIALLKRRNATQELKALLAENLTSEDPVPFLRIALDQALAESNEDEARLLLQALGAHLTPTSKTQREIAIRQARLERRFGQPARALRVLDQALGLSPFDLSLRKERALVLQALGRLRETRLDIEFILEHAPEDAFATSLLQKLGQTPQ